MTQSAAPQDETKDRVVLDATLGCRKGNFVFCPVEGDLDGEYAIVTGMNYVSPTVPTGKRLVAIVHEDGQDAVEAFCREHAESLNAWASSLPVEGARDAG